MRPDLTKSSRTRGVYSRVNHIYCQVLTLVDAGIVEEVLLPEDRRQNDLLYKFYLISDGDRKFLEDHKLLRTQGTLNDIYNQLVKIDEIKRYGIALWPSTDAVSDFISQMGCHPNCRHFECDGVPSIRSD